MGPPHAQPLGDDADEGLRRVDHDELHGLTERAVDDVGDDLGVSELKLVPLAAHRLDEDG